MRPQAVKAHLEKVLAYTSSLQGKYIYKNTRDQLREYADLCQQILTAISNINDPNSDISMLSEVDDVEVVQQYTRSECSDIVKRFGRVLSDNAKTQYTEDSTRGCSTLIWQWYHDRYLKQYPDQPRFRYNVIHIKKYIYAIIIAFGYHYELGDIQVLCDEFQKWSDSLNTERGNSYPVPYEIFQICKKITMEQATMTAARVWHQMMNGGLFPVRRDDEKGAYLKYQEFLDRLFSVNPWLEDIFTEEVLQNDQVYTTNG